MKVKRYIGDTVQEALQKVRTELGKDAVIINTRKIKKRGLKGLFSKPIIEVVAAVDDYERSSPNERKDIKEYSSGIRSESLVNKPESFKESMNSIKNSYLNNSNETKSMEQEFNEIKSMLNKVYKVIKLDEDSISDIAKQYILRLRNAEVDEEIIEKLKDKIEKLTMDLQSSEDFIRNFIHNTLLDLITLENENVDTEPKKVAVFIGPTGVGKTTTMAKLAALYTLTKKKKVGFITSDTYRIAAVEQLRTYSDIIGIPLTVVYSPQEFASAVENYKEEDIIMVDTAGRSHKDKYQLMELKHLLDSDIESQVYLVISAGTKMSDCRDILNSYSFLEDYKLLFTKLDETSSYGAIVNLSYMTKKPLSYLTYGQSVPDDIEVADKSKIINSLLGDKLYEGSSR
ncbi:flagellar biosynthesis protein FlhF [Lutispora saccharofermentans]|jgi:flagellar biosynthesis protein FlhF|uniref:Flagellar biosynthesis protein FlhF n=1 Tax=Lutispora saccharofermentans TaxID=3024236 RepID=A0ABT1NA57_9FIRM|nr:flagellar biosynthesis protein FlhF [Lutispora saccharofermentans]MCQ1527981.1 flagellar biosynthesis protein FlhF [Lutispora saccharofermentans]